MGIKLFEFEIMGVKVNVMLSFVIFIMLFARLVEPDHPAMAALAILQALLIHELGHAFIFTKMGARPLINLRFAGGEAVAIIPPRKNSLGWNMLLNISGVACNFLLAGIAFLIFSFLGHLNPNVKTFFGLLLDINLILGIFNSLPVVPLDGGRFIENLFTKFAGPAKAAVWTTNLSLVGSVCFVIWGLTSGFILLLAFGVIFFLHNYARMKNR